MKVNTSMVMKYRAVTGGAATRLADRRLLIYNEI